jgi:hypothetical protein
MVNSWMDVVGLFPVKMRHRWSEGTAHLDKYHEAFKNQKLTFLVIDWRR